MPAWGIYLYINIATCTHPMFTGHVQMSTVVFHSDKMPMTTFSAQLGGYSSRMETQKHNKGG